MFHGDISVWWVCGNILNIQTFIHIKLVVSNCQTGDRVKDLAGGDVLPRTVLNIIFINPKPWLKTFSMARIDCETYKHVNLDDKSMTALGCVLGQNLRSYNYTVCSIKTRQFQDHRIINKGLGGVCG